MSLTEAIASRMDASFNVMADCHAPIDAIGTGSHLPERWGETCATADIVACDGAARVKVGREFLLRGPRP